MGIYVLKKAGASAGNTLRLLHFSELRQAAPILSNVRFEGVVMVWCAKNGHFRPHPMIMHSNLMAWRDVETIF